MCHRLQLPTETRWPAVACRPMQIAYVRESECSRGPGPTLWERFGVNAEPGKPLSVSSPADAIDTAARNLREDMGAPSTGGTFAECHEATCRGEQR
jgi:hypothetical protein